MATEQPSYQRHTRASLGRVTVVFKPEKKTASEKQIQWRKRVTKQRLDLADKIRQHLAPTEKWPDISAVRSYRERKHQKRITAKNASSPTAPRSSVSPKTSSAGSSSSEFPIPIRTSKDLLTFPQFPLLPTELRLLIWKEAIFVPKFIELIYCLDEQERPGVPRQSPYSTAQFINYQRYDVLSAVCLESREISRAFSPNPEKLSRLKLEETSYLPVIPNPRPVFDPERDTLFFRPIDHSLENGLHRLPASLWRNMRSLQHIAIPLDLKQSNCYLRSFSRDFNYFSKLKTLTFMIGCAEKSWHGDPSIELRDMEQWFADGRRRTIIIDHSTSAYLPHGERVTEGGAASRRLHDVAELPDFVARFARPRTSIAVRVVAWKRNISW